jgi:beta-glucosidase
LWSAYQSSTISALKAGLIDESDIDRALVNIFTIRIRTGEFDPKSKVPYSNIGPDVINAPAHIELAIEAATKTPVLLKNSIVPGTNKKVLPLKAPDLKTIAVIGPKADMIELGQYSGKPLDINKITPLAGIKALLAQKGSNAEVLFNQGANTFGDSNLFCVSSFELVKTDGSFVKHEATKFSASSEGIIVASLLGPQLMLRRVNDGAWTSYNDMDVSNLKSINIRLNVMGDGGLIEVRTASVSGNILASFDIKSSGEMGWAKTITVNTTVNQLGLTGNQTLCFVYRKPNSGPIDQEAVKMASASDIAIVFVGTDVRIWSEAPQCVGK